MKINGKSFDNSLRPAANKPTSGVQSTSTDASKAQPTSGTSGATAGKSDSVQISDAGRALATGGTSGSSSLSAERVAELRKRVLEGAYNSTHVVDQVAKRILERGDA
ncbi:MAG: flagellar biosynthesis anti-sigma factor FlgM [Gemmatirosa sp.]|nr:flagellar biosynthesis anti-sigma factor FlgM [Gemmatirosa sp.]